MNVLRWLDKNLEAFFIGVSLVVMVVVMTAQIVCRQVFGFSLVWAEELCRHFFIWSACWGLAYTIRIRGAIKFDIIVNLFPQKGKVVFEIISNAIVFAFLLYMFPACWNVVVFMKTTATTALPYNQDFVYLISMLGIVLSAVRAFQMILLDARSLAKKETEERGEA